ncbi:MAG: phage head closure protein [Erysipelotrichaceae bacterium]|nr:phage head closure protein [Erysipelotrichaceae bacterium]
MDRSEVLYLIAETMSQDENGVWHKTLTERKVFCQVDSVTRSEFFEAGRNGLNPEFRFTIFFGDYADEREVRYKGKTYAVYRTYHARTDTLELYVERKGGTN